MPANDKFVPIIILIGGKTKWKAKNSIDSQCLHFHKSEEAAQKCCDRLNKPTENWSNYNGQYQYAAGYPD